MKTSSVAAERMASKRRHSQRQAERQFVREVLSRKPTPEVQARLAEAAQFAKSALESPFLAKFCKPAA